jgi:hypothetical protein
MAALVLAARNPNYALDQVHIAPLQMLDFNGPERGVGSQNRREINQLPIRITAGNLQQPVLFFVTQSAPNAGGLLIP